MRKKLLPAHAIENRIIILRDQRVILDNDLAAIYGVTTKTLNQAVRRNAGRFPADFAFFLGPQEVRNMRSQMVTASQKHRDPHFQTRAFTEHGAIMAATVLNSPFAVKMSVFVVRAFIKMRAMLQTQHQLARKLKELEERLTERLDIHEHAISDIIKQIMQMFNPSAEPDPPQKPIGFQVREPSPVYGDKSRQRKKHI